MKPRLSGWLFIALCLAGVIVRPSRPSPDKAGGPFTRAYLGEGAELPTRTPEAQRNLPSPKTTVPEIPTAVPEPQTLEGLEIEIQNGSGAPKVALKLSVALDRRRIRTLRVYNADRWNYATTQIRARPAFAESARMLAELLGLDETNLSLEGKIAEDADLVVILGQDHDRVVRKASRRDEP